MFQKRFYLLFTLIAFCFELPFLFLSGFSVLTPFLVGLATALYLGNYLDERAPWRPDEKTWVLVLKTCFIFFSYVGACELIRHLSRSDVELYPNLIWKTYSLVGTPSPFCWSWVCTSL